MGRKEDLLAKIEEIREKIEDMTDRQEKLKGCSSIYKAILELDDIIAESEATLKTLEDQYKHVEHKPEDYHWDDLEQNIYRSFDSFHKSFTKAGTMFKRFK